MPLALYPDRLGHVCEGHCGKRSVASFGTGLPSASYCSGAKMNQRDLRFFGFIAGCLVAAGLLFSLIVSGEVIGPRVAELPSQQTHSR
jgi:hypothetical protein